ncbi:MAG: hypothetical protein B1H11_07710 [Desulfobacteraceae bacterium 4484_190.1]|nr:MAG: hypothetical protein B1H11_07710 [Desulfobacteraceae bacterium 4484_190.1]
MLLSIPQQYRAPYMQRSAIAKVRDQRLRQTIHWAYQNVPFYRQEIDHAGLRPSVIRSIDDLSLLPVISEGQLRDDPLQFLSGCFRPQECCLLKSGGSTGIQKTIYHDFPSLLMNIAYSERQDSLYRRVIGRRFRYRVLRIDSPESTQRNVRKAYLRLLQPLLALGPRHEQVDISTPFEEKVRRINRFRPSMVTGYSRAVAELYDRARRENLPIFRPALIRLGGEALPVELRKMLEEYWKIPVLMSYQSNESLKIGFECEQRNGYHLHEDLCIVRIVDENDHCVPDGETGRVIITNLVNRGSVLINFDQGDTGRIIPGPCACGRTFRRLELEKTRRNPLLKTPDGRVIHPAEVIMFVAKWPEVAMVQVIVEKPDQWRIGIVTKDREKTGAWLYEAGRVLQEDIAGPSVNIRMEILDEPEKSDVGKTLRIIIRCWGEEPYV